MVNYEKKEGHVDVGANEGDSAGTPNAADTIKEEAEVENENKISVENSPLLRCYSEGSLKKFRTLPSRTY